MVCASSSRFRSLLRMIRVKPWPLIAPPGLHQRAQDGDQLLGAAVLQVEGAQLLAGRRRGDQQEQQGEEAAQWAHICSLRNCGSGSERSHMVWNSARRSRPWIGALKLPVPSKRSASRRW